MANSLHQRIKTHVLPDVSESAKIAVNLDFNPSGVKQVDVLKMLAAALITECEKVRDAADGPVQARRASVAITAVEDASMWAVKAATTKSDEAAIT